MPSKGRPPKLLDPKRRERILTLLRGGHYRKVAAEAGGIPETTLSKWMILGERKPESVYGAFRKEVIEAETAAHEESLRIIREHAQTDPKQAQWWLARKYPDLWADKTRIQHEGVKGGEPIIIKKVDVKDLVNPAEPDEDE